MSNKVLKDTAQRNNKLLDHFTKGDISKKALNAVRNNNRAASAETLKVIKAKGSDAGNVSNDIIQKLFG